MLKQMIARIALIAALVLAIVPVLQTSASAAAASCPGVNSGFYNGYNGTSCTGTVLIHSQAAAGSRNVDVANDQVSSANNGTGNKWCGVQEQLNDYTIFTFFSHTNYGGLGTANNKIDHYDVVSGGGDCPE